MPRIYDKNGDPLDYCQDCFPDEEAFLEGEGCWDEKASEPKCKFCNKRRVELDNGGCGYSHNEDHPAYGHVNYTCHECGAELGESDD